MKVKEIGVSLGRKINLGHYESGEVKAYITMEIGENDKIEEAYEICYKITGHSIAKQMQELKKR